MVQMGHPTGWATIGGFNGVTHFFWGIGHMDADGTMSLLSTSITSKGVVEIEKGVVYKNDSAIIKGWFWK
jgi:hypothetical protein